MKLYVMRHGPAEDDSPTGRDADRALTLPGRDRTRAVARALHEEEEAPFIVISSPLVRALQTAEIVATMTDLEKRIVGTKKAREAGATGTVEVRRELSPGGNAHGLVWELARAGRKRVMIVGHEPDLSTLVQRLVGVVPDEGMLKAMVVGIKLTPTSDDVQGVGFTSKLRFVLHPKTLDWQRA